MIAFRPSNKASFPLGIFIILALTFESMSICQVGQKHANPQKYSHLNRAAWKKNAAKADKSRPDSTTGCSLHSTCAGEA